jgi:L-erythro-3,5-diaminohexanoate dehydrogenase
MALPEFAELDPYGTYRVIEPQGVLPQQAWRLDNRPVAQDNEILCDVEWLNIDAASFRQIRETTDGSSDAIAAHILAIVQQRGKQHNAVTGSGGMFIGRVAQIGAALKDTIDLQVGDHIASLVSLTLTPLLIEEILEVDTKLGRLNIRGKAILFASGLWTHLPSDLPMAASLALFDVAGAPALVSRRAQTGMTVLVIGADGKSGLLACAAAHNAVGSTGRVYGVVPDRQTPGARLLHDTGLANVIEADARNALDLYRAVSQHANPLPTLVINCVNVGGTEVGSILCTAERGTIVFFSMATSFSAAALGAEGLGRDIDLVIGNGYVRGHALHARKILGTYAALEEYFVATYGGAGSI